jgi:predicted DNA-binding transcriptional regulator AlpA
MADIENSNLKLVDLNEVLSRVKISQSTLYRMMSRGEFPRQLKLGSRSFGSEPKSISSSSKCRSERLSGRHAPAFLTQDCGSSK